MLKALPLKWGQLKLGLPPPGFAASLAIVDYVDPYVREFLEIPDMALLPESKWPLEVPRAKVQAKRKDDWYEVAYNLCLPGILRLISLQDVLQPRGDPVLNGAFEVGKAGEAPPRGGPYSPFHNECSSNQLISTRLKR